jgi:hypothetical protein
MAYGYYVTITKDMWKDFEEAAFKPLEEQSNLDFSYDLTDLNNLMQTYSEIVDNKTAWDVAGVKEGENVNAAQYEKVIAFLQDK